MNKYLIEEKDGFDYITDSDNKLTLKVIPPNKQNYDVAYPYSMVVAGVFEDNRPEPSKEDFESEEEYVTALFEKLHGYGEYARYDFESADIAFNDTDMKEQSNKHIWLAAINYYSQLKLDRATIDLIPHNYDFSDVNW